jgi:very-short-patch-repair endonuclease
MSISDSNAIPSYKQTWFGDALTDRQLSCANGIQRNLKMASTPQERAFIRAWTALRPTGRKSAVHLTPQKVFKVTPEYWMVPDFYCKDFKAVIEIDGNHHYVGAQKVKDEFRDRLLGERGIVVVRVPNWRVDSDCFAAVRFVLRLLLDRPGFGQAKRRLAKQLTALKQRRPKAYALVFPNGDHWKMLPEAT